MSVLDGQNANAATFNSAFASKSQDNTLTGKQTLSRPGSGATVVDTQQAINDVIASDALKIPLAEKGVANGVATLDASTLVPVAQIPDLTASKITDFSSAADARITLQKGAASGIAPLDASSKIDSTYLPSYVDDVVEVANYAALPVTGETGKIYVTLDTNKTYRWSGSVYVQIGQPIASTSDVPEGTNLYYTAARVADKQIGIQFQDQGSNLGTTATVDTIDFIGAGIQATRASNKVTVEVTATGSGGGSKNYFSQSSINPDFETGSVSPWQAMTTTWSGNTPTNAPSAGASFISFNINTVDPLAGTTSASMSKGIGNGQYQGVMSGVFTVDREDLAKVLYGSFAYEVSGTVAANFDVSGTSSQTVEIWVYNVNANQWIQPAGFRGINQFTGSGKVTFSFQTDATPANNQYRICLINKQTTTGVWNLKVDDFLVGPQAVVLGSAMTDWQSYGSSASYTGFGTVSSNTQFYRRVGDSVELMIKFTAGTGTATEARIALPSGLTSSDTSKIPSISICGSFGGTSNSYHNTVTIEPSVTYITFSLQNGTGSSFTKLQGTAFSSQTVSVIAKLPIQGWGSFSQMSSDTDTRVVDLQVNNASSITPSGTIGTSFGTATNINFNKIPVKDSHGSYNAGIYTIPVSGDYFISSRVEMSHTSSTGTFIGLAVSVNNIERMTQGIKPALSNAYPFVSGLVTGLIAGDQVAIRLFSDSSSKAFVSSVVNDFTVHRLSGPSVITATETVAARYTNASAQSIPNNSTVAITGWTKDFDTHQMFNTSSGIVTIPISGKYTFSNMTTYNSGSITLPSEFSIDIQQAGSVSRSIKLGAIFAQSSNSYFVSVVGSTTIHCNAGDTVTIVAFQSSGAARTLAGGASFNHLSITRVGN